MSKNTYIITRTTHDPYDGSETSLFGYATSKESLAVLINENYKKFPNLVKQQSFKYDDEFVIYETQKHFAFGLDVKYLQEDENIRVVSNDELKELIINKKTPKP